MPQIAVDPDGRWHILRDGEPVCVAKTAGNEIDGSTEFVKIMEYTEENLDHPDPPWCSPCVMFVDKTSLPMPPRLKNSPRFDYSDIFSGRR